MNADIFDKIKKELEGLQRPSGAFVAAGHKDYWACWIRDQLYISLCYYYTREPAKLRQGIWVVFDILQKHRRRIEEVINTPPHTENQYLHAKYHPDTFEEIAFRWGHHQIDAIGLFLHTVADLKSKGIYLVRNKSDKEIIQLLVFYLLSTRYWEWPDNGMWEEQSDLHSSSIGAALAGLIHVREQDVAIAPDFMISQGREALDKLLPSESPEHEVDMAQLSLIWPYGIVTHDTAERILENIENKLIQKHGVNRYLGDEYCGSKKNGPGEWPLGFFWISIACSSLEKNKQAQYWFERGMEQVLDDGRIPEIYRSEKPNPHTPLGWAQSFAIIAKTIIEESKEKLKTA